MFNLKKISVNDILAELQLQLDREKKRILKLSQCRIVSKYQMNIFRRTRYQLNLALASV